MHWTNATPTGRSTLVLGRDGHADAAPEAAPDELPDPRHVLDEHDDGDDHPADAWVRVIDPAAAADRPDDDGGRAIPRLRRADRA